jgi:hypothetical protein
MLGMRSDPDFLSESLNNPDQFPEDPLAMPMTSTEAAEVWDRVPF